MINILPTELKKEIVKEYTLRLSIVIALLFLFVQISFLVFLIPSWVLSFYKEKDASSQVTLMNESPITQSVKTSSAVILATNNKLQILNSTLSYPEVLPLFNTIVSHKTNSIHIQEFTYISTGAKAAKIVLQGVSVNRESLVSFVKALQETNTFASVDLPVSNLAKDKNLTFAITLLVGKTEVVVPAQEE